MVSTGSSVVMNNTADIQKYKVYRDTPLPQDNKGLKPTATARRIIKNITPLNIAFRNLKYINNACNPYVFLFANSYHSMSLRKE
jgi:hypothetical protein